MVGLLLDPGFCTFEKVTLQEHLRFCSPAYVLGLAQKVFYKIFF